MTHRLTFLGAAGTVTGSKYFLEIASRRLLIDCGLFQGLKRLRERNWQPLPFDLKTLDAVVLTHAHLDRTGYLPARARAGFRGPVYCTAATRDLLAILLPDSARLQEEEAQYANRRKFSKHSPALPLYTEDDAQAALRLLRPVEWSAAVPMAADVTRIYHEHLNEHRLTEAECKAMCTAAHFVNSGEESKSLNRQHGPMTIVSASGMATGGRVLHHLKAFAPDEKNMILFTGYQAAGTRGAALVGGAEHGEAVTREARRDAASTYAKS